MSFDLAARLAERQAADLFRSRPLLQTPQGPQVRADDQELLAFCSNDYLGLANHPEVIRALQQGAEQWGVGGGASHLVIGHSTPHHELEEALAAFTGRPRALLFSTGYMANLAVVTALLGPSQQACQRGGEAESPGAKLEGVEEEQRLVGRRVTLRRLVQQGHGLVPGAGVLVDLRRLEQPRPDPRKASVPIDWQRPAVPGYPT